MFVGMTVIWSLLVGFKVIALTSLPMLTATLWETMGSVLQPHVSLSRVYLTPKGVQNGHRKLVINASHFILVKPILN